MLLTRQKQPKVEEQNELFDVIPPFHHPTSNENNFLFFDFHRCKKKYDRPQTYAFQTKTIFWIVCLFSVKISYFVR